MNSYLDNGDTEQNTDEENIDKYAKKVVNSMGYEKQKTKKHKALIILGGLGGCLLLTLAVSKSSSPSLVNNTSWFVFAVSLSISCYVGVLVASKVSKKPQDNSVGAKDPQKSNPVASIARGLVVLLTFMFASLPVTIYAFVLLIVLQQRYCALTNPKCM